MRAFQRARTVGRRGDRAGTAGALGTSAGGARRSGSSPAAPYATAGNGPSSVDCSGLTVWAFRAAGISLPRTSDAQCGMGSPVARAQIQARELVFVNTSGPGASHVGIATGPGSVISATTHGVREYSISDAYWGSHYVGRAGSSGDGHSAVRGRLPYAPSPS